MIRTSLRALWSPFKCLQVRLDALNGCLVQYDSRADYDKKYAKGHPAPPTRRNNASVCSRGSSHCESWRLPCVAGWRRGQPRGVCRKDTAREPCGGRGGQGDGGVSPVVVLEGRPRRGEPGGGGGGQGDGEGNPAVVLGRVSTVVRHGPWALRWRVPPANLAAFRRRHVGRTVTPTLAVVAEGEGGGKAYEGGEGRGISVKGGSGAAAGVLWARGRWPVSRAAAEEATMRRAGAAAGNQR